MVYCLCSLVSNQIYHRSTSFPVKYTMKSMVYCPHLPLLLLVNVRRLVWRISRGIGASHYYIVNQGALKLSKRNFKVLRHGRFQSQCVINSVSFPLKFNLKYDAVETAIRTPKSSGRVVVFKVIVWREVQPRSFGWVLKFWCFGWLVAYEEGFLIEGRLYLYSYPLARRCHIELSVWKVRNWRFCTQLEGRPGSSYEKKKKER